MNLRSHSNMLIIKHLHYLNYTAEIVKTIKEFVKTAAKNGIEMNVCLLNEKYEKKEFKRIKN